MRHSMSTAGDDAYGRPRRRRMDITKQSPRASVAHQRFLFNGEKTCIDCHKGIAHHLPDMRGIPGWQ